MIFTYKMAAKTSWHVERISQCCQVKIEGAFPSAHGCHYFKKLHRLTGYHVK